MIGHSKLFANISSYGDYPFPEQFSVFRELMERYFNAILFVNFFLTPGNTTVLRHISDYTTTCKHVNIESWPSMPRSRATRPRSSEAAAILEKGVYLGEQRRKQGEREVQVARVLPLAHDSRFALASLPPLFA